MLISDVVTKADEIADGILVAAIESESHRL
jgi:hypothetical protein